ncbi:response regulator [Frigidibacter mobilis]|uniref:Diguanylate cyclase n=1 Tax=Frigidibacter mobilis TaxID=1335048 RepID=A0A161GWA3_9RHOB|nr:response regulator [Frigidibacter mobilis]AMY68529.1 diguanylate cyclase [Frigidibacter mobilis]
MRILAVDDDEMILELLSASLGAAGFADLTVACSAAQTLEKIAAVRIPFDCFLLDIQMPEVDGIELCRAIRRNPIYAAAPIIMITAMSQKSYIDRAFAAGATDYVTKPFDPVELGARIRLAARMVESERALTENRSAVATLRAQLERERFVDLNEPISIPDVDAVIDLQALENYLLQLSRSGLFATSIFAFKIAGIETIYAATSPIDFRYLLTDVAEAISTALRAHERFVAYAGNGVYVCVAHGRGALDLEVIEGTANLIVEEMALTNSRGVPLKLHLRIGSPVRVGLVRAGRGAVDALYVAIENAEQQAPKAEDGRAAEHWSQFRLA